jgi:hypothetical protein
LKNYDEVCYFCGEDDEKRITFYSDSLGSEVHIECVLKHYPECSDAQKVVKEFDFEPKVLPEKEEITITCDVLGCKNNITIIGRYFNNIHEQMIEKGWGVLESTLVYKHYICPECKKTRGFNWEMYF